VAAIKETPDKDAAAARLLRNQEDIGNAVVPLYGDDAGKGLTVLLKQHILIAVDLVEAGDEARFQTEDEKWSRNVEEIATFLSGANPKMAEERCPRSPQSASHSHQGGGRCPPAAGMGERCRGVR
jgi:hypothetical protein